jgi:cysteinyl-tRNA synthetase
MESTSSTAHVEPKQKSQDPAAKAKRLKRLLANPDFAEAVEFERSECRKSTRLVEEATELLKQSESTALAVAKQIEGLVEVQTDYIEQLKENKELNKVIETLNSTIKSQDEVISANRRSINALKEILELDKKARNPNRVTGGKRGRPQGSKSKAVTFGAEAMPDNDLVTFGTSLEFEAALMYA